MPSKIDLITRAALNIGADPISSLNEDTVDAEVWSAIWPEELNRALDSTPWAFATKTIELSRLIDAPADPNWTYQYQLPADHRASRTLMDSSGRELRAGEWTTEGNLILSGQDRLILKYERTISDDDVPSLPTWFQYLVTTLLANRACEKLTGLGSVYQRTLAEANVALKNARIADARSSPPRFWGEPSTWRAARWTA